MTNPPPLQPRLRQGDTCCLRPPPNRSFPLQVIDERLTQWQAAKIVRWITGRTQLFQHVFQLMAAK
ncbi:MAG: hypothetical protein H7A46_12400 [Verrucomicrobiales bacterium]|nr:hypothetical protein [Verrucomicrobiales bacterium]